MKNKHLIITLLGCLMAVSASADVVYEPLVVDSGFNRDVIAEVANRSHVCDYAVSYLYGAGSSTHHCYYSMATTSVVNVVNEGQMNDEDFALASQTGWPDDPTNDPENRIVRCIEDAKDNPKFANVIWQLAPYNEPNALALRPDTDDEDEAEGLFNQGKGTIKFKKVGCYQKLYFLIVSPKIGTGCTQDSNDRGVHAQVHYTDGTSSEIIYFASIGLSGQNGARVCKTNIYEGIYKKNTKTKDPNKAYACAYEFDIDHNKLIKSIEFENKKACTGSVILAVTGMTADVAAPTEEASVASNIDENSFEACWEAVAEAASYRLDVAEDPDFQHILADYNNLVVSGSTCQEVAGLIAENDYYWRVRSVNSAGGQSASSAPKRVKTQGAGGPQTTNETDNTIEADMTPLVGSTMNIIVNRTLYKDGAFNTLCLPFNLDAAGIAASPLAGGELYVFDGADVLGTAQLDIHVAPATAIEAGKPYLIKWSNTGEVINNLTFSGVTIETDHGQRVGEENEVQFVGILGKYQMPSNTSNLFLGADNTLYWPLDDGTSLKGFRAYFEIPTSGAQAVKRDTPARIVMGTSVTTDVESVSATFGGSHKLLRNGQLYILRDGKMYDIFGRLVD